MNNVLLELKHWGVKRQNHWVFKSLALEIRAGELLHLTGKNGVGKTTLLRSILGLIAPGSGSITFQGQELERARGLQNQAINFLGHQIAIKPYLSVEQNLVCLTALSNAPKSQVDIEKLLAENQMLQYRHTLAQYLSAGQLQKVALMRLMMNRAELWLLDEPFTSLDDASVSYWQKNIADLVEQQNLAVLLVDHKTTIQQATQVSFASLLTT